MVKDEQQAFVDKMYQERGYILDFHQVMVAEDFDFLKTYNQLIEAGYTKQRTLDAKTKEIIYTVILTAVKASTDHIKAHIGLALEYGATKKTERFFESLGPRTKSIIESAFTVDGKSKPAEALAKLLYAVRSEFVHRAELVLELTAGTLVSVRGEQVIVSEFSLRDLQAIFEQGLLQHFNFVPYRK